MHSLCTGGAALQSERIVPYRCVCKYSYMFVHVAKKRGEQKRRNHLLPSVGGTTRFWTTIRPCYTALPNPLQLHLIAYPTRLTTVIIYPSPSPSQPLPPRSIRNRWMRKYSRSARTRLLLAVIMTRLLLKWTHYLLPGAKRMALKTLEVTH